MVDPWPGRAPCLRGGWSRCPRRCTATRWSAPPRTRWPPPRWGRCRRAGSESSPGPGPWGWRSTGCCTVLYCTVLHCTVPEVGVVLVVVLYCTVLYCTVPEVGVVLVVEGGRLPADPGTVEPGVEDLRIANSVSSHQSSHLWSLNILILTMQWLLVPPEVWSQIPVQSSPWCPGNLCQERGSYLWSWCRGHLHNPTWM